MSGKKQGANGDPEIIGGALVFSGTRVPIRTLLDYLAAGHPLSVFLEDFPTVTRQQSIALLEQANRVLNMDARPSR